MFNDVYPNDRVHSLFFQYFLGSVLYLFISLLLNKMAKACLFINKKESSHYLFVLLCHEESGCLRFEPTTAGFFTHPCFPYSCGNVGRRSVLCLIELKVCLFGLYLLELRRMVPLCLLDQCIKFLLKTFMLEGDQMIYTIPDSWPLHFAVSFNKINLINNKINIKKWTFLAGRPLQYIF
jgi:hypothetical protein